MSTAYLVHHYPKSKYYYIRVKDNKNSYEMSTDIKLTAADIKRIEQKKNGEIKKVVLYGNDEINSRLRNISGSRKEEANKEVFKIKRTGIKISEAWELFAREMSNPKDILRQAMAKSSLLNYSKSIQHFIDAIGDIELKKLTPYQDGSGEHYNKFRKYFGIRLSPGEIPANKSGKLYSLTSFEINCRQINSVLNYAANSLSLNIAKVLPHMKSKTEKKDVIPYNELQVIFDELFKEDPRMFAIIYFLFLTGCRQSTVIVQTVTGINFTDRTMNMINVKRKHKPYDFVIFDELFELLKRLLPVPAGNDRLFYDFPFTETSMAHSFKSWSNFFIPKLLLEGKISRAYEIKSLRETFVNFTTQVAGIELIVAKIMVDHDFSKDITITHYYNASNPAFRDMVINKFANVKFWQNFELLRKIPNFTSYNRKTVHFLLEEKQKSCQGGTPTQI